MVAYRVEQSVRRVSADVEKITGTAADLSRKVDRIAEKMERFEQRARDSLQVEEAKHLMGELARLHGPQPEGRADPDAVAEAEIHYLLETIRRSGYRFGHSDRTASANNYYLRFHGKFVLYKKTIKSAEDFIEKIGTKTMGGNAYYLLDGESKRPLREWLLEQLRKRRGAGKAEKK